MSPAAPLKWRPGASPERTITTDEVNVYVVIRESRGKWLISAWDNTRFQDVRRLSGTTAPTRTLARAIVAEYVVLGEDFSSAAHGGKERTTVAILAAYEADAIRLGKRPELAASPSPDTSSSLPEVSGERHRSSARPGRGVDLGCRERSPAA